MKKQVTEQANLMNEMKESFMSLAHIRTDGEFILGLKFTILGLTFSAITNFLLGIFISNWMQFMTISAAVILDFVFGVWAGSKLQGFQTRKASKSILKFFAYNTFLYFMLLIESGNPLLMWMSEAIMTPIILFQLISTLKNMSRIGLISNQLLSTLLDKIDKHKDL
tara:strand:- start:59 stop:556 length:498 start_codon:yes stop_codon:yes gene_type:complete